MPSWTVSAVVIGLPKEEGAFEFLVVAALPAPWGATFNNQTGELRIIGELDADDEASAIMAGTDVALAALPDGPGKAVVVTACPTEVFLASD